MSEIEKFASNPATSRLPFEVVNLACRFVHFEDLRWVAAISQVWWHAACSILWRRVNNLERLLRAALGETFKAIQWRDDEDYWDMLETDEEEEEDGWSSSDDQDKGPLGTTFGPDRFRSLSRVAAYVQQLNIYGVRHVGPLYFGSGPLRALVDNPIRLFFPRLRRLSIGPVDWTDPLRAASSWPSHVYDLDLLALFLTDSVVRLAARCKPGTLDMVKLRDRAPSLQQLHLRLDEVDVDSDDSDDSNNETRHGLTPAERVWARNWPRWAMERLMGWEHLSTLSFNALFLDRHTATPLSRLPLLTKLTIKCSGDRTSRWEDVCFAPGGFAQLNDLSVEAVDLRDALYLSNQQELMGGLVALKITVAVDATSEPPDDVADLYESIAHQAPRLRRLHVDSYLFTAQGLHSLARLPLTHLTIRAPGSIDGMEILLLGLNPDLEFLCVPEILAPVTFLTDLAPMFSKLRALELSLTVSSLDGFSSQEPSSQELENRFPGPLDLSVYLHKDTEGDQVDKAAVRLALYRYVKRVWKDMRLIMSFV